MKNIKKKKGFTLIELLAVIVVLALILVLTIPTVLKTMNDSKKKTFQMYGQKVVNAAMQLQESVELLGSSSVESGLMDGKRCYTFRQLGLESGNYEGAVVVEKSGADTKYTVYLADDNFAYNAKPSTEINSGEAEITTDTATVKSKAATCTVSGS